MLALTSGVVCRGMVCGMQELDDCADAHGHRRDRAVTQRRCCGSERRNVARADRASFQAGGSGRAIAVE